jgi:hypothetical protein
MGNRRSVIVVAVAFVIALAVAGGARFYASAALGARATVYALPLVIMAVTRDEMLSRPGAQLDRFYDAPTLATPASRTVVRPNADTLYSSAWLDLSRGPVILTMPPSNGRFFMVQCMDAWTNDFADPGIRTLGNSAARFEIVGPQWHGSPPARVREIRSPTAMAWLLARVFVRNRADLSAAHAYQHELDVRPLGHVDTSVSIGTAAPHREIMAKILRTMSAQAFFDRFMALTRENPPSTADAPFIANVLRPLGLVPGSPAHWTDLSLARRLAVSAGFHQAIDATVTRVGLHLKHGRTASGWTGPAERTRIPHGSYGTNYVVRAIIAVHGLAAKSILDGTSFTARTDIQGARLDGTNRYRITFPANDLPPVNGFWSITLYDSDGYLVPNAIDRYAIRPGEHLAREPDGSIVIFVQPNEPCARYKSNWLPSPAGTPFDLALRAYWPKPAILNGTWSPPPIVPVDQ